MAAVVSSLDRDGGRGHGPFFAHQLRQRLARADQPSSCTLTFRADEAEDRLSELKGRLVRRGPTAAAVLSPSSVRSSSPKASSAWSPTDNQDQRGRCLQVRCQEAIAGRSGSRSAKSHFGPDHVGAHGLSPPAQFAIRRDEGDLSIGGTIGDVNERVVAAAGGVHDVDAVGKAGRGTLPGLALEDHGHRSGDPSCGDGCSHLLHERTGRSCSVPPPAGGTGSDDVGCVNEKHRPSLIAPATWLPPLGVHLRRQPPT